MKLAASLRLQNTGSVARDHLANERTFLAWLRTSLTFASVGVALTQLFQLKLASIDTSSKAHASRKLSIVLGTLFISSGILITFIGATRYFSVQHLLTKDKFPASRGLILVVFTLTLALTAYVLAILISMAD